MITDQLKFNTNFYNKNYKIDSIYDSTVYNNKLKVSYILGF